MYNSKKYKEDKAYKTQIDFYNNRYAAEHRQERKHSAMKSTCKAFIDREGAYNELLEVRKLLDNRIRDMRRKIPMNKL